MVRNRVVFNLNYNYPYKYLYVSDFSYILRILLVEQKNKSQMPSFCNIYKTRTSVGHMMHVDETRVFIFSSFDKPHKKGYNFLYENRVDKMSISLES